MLFNGANFNAVANPFVPLQEAATIITDASRGNAFQVTLTGNRTLGAPVNVFADGQSCMWCFVQDGTGNRTITLNAIFVFGSTVTSFALSTAAGAIDYMAAIYRQAINKWHVTAIAKGF